MAGRRSKYTTDVVDRLIGALEIGATDEHACAAAGIDESTFYRWQAQKSDFRDRVHGARPNGWLSDLQVILRAAADGDWRAAAEHLDRTRSPYRKSVELTGKDGGPIAFDHGWAALRTVILAAVAANADALPEIEAALAALEPGDA